MPRQPPSGTTIEATGMAFEHIEMTFADGTRAIDDVSFEVAPAEFVTIVGPYLAALTTGTVFIEAIFGIPGLGLYFADAARSRDMPLLMGSTMFFALILMSTNLLVDLAYRLLDPRIGFDTSGGS